MSGLPELPEGVILSLDVDLSARRPVLIDMAGIDYLTLDEARAMTAHLIAICEKASHELGPGPASECVVYLDSREASQIRLGLDRLRLWVRGMSVDLNDRDLVALECAADLIAQCWTQARASEEPCSGCGCRKCACV